MRSPEFKTLRNLFAVTVLTLIPLAGCKMSSAVETNCNWNSAPNSTNEVSITCRNNDETEFERLMSEVEKECSIITRTKFLSGNILAGNAKTRTQNCLNEIQSSRNNHSK